MPVKYSPELEQRAVELVLPAQADPDITRGAITRAADGLAEAQRANSLLKQSAFFVAEPSRPQK